ncbi:hypothetical protein HAZT_HAZT009693 [Hyalella azteca]|uniref:Peptidase S1 domain-containing protein n=1 Tax=Hyalella azteca TaxID=294128 RepID=A0A6A0H4P4_HYAAZ|nr:hypothetical protein HAZT_HAZT009693 [Hyalella azteca]
MALLIATAASAPDGGWSWGSEEKKAAAAVAEAQSSANSGIEQGRSHTKHFNTDGNVINIPAGGVSEPLPLEPHAPSTPAVVQAQLVGQVSQAGVVGETEKDRQARFLGISDTLCSWGVGVRCDNKIKKKGHGYPPSINSQYGVPVQAYDNYGAPYGSYVPEQTFNHHKNKGNKKGGGVTDLISGFIDSYTKPKPEKGYKPSKLPTYLPPAGSLQGAYEVPIYVAEPIQPFPTYGAPQPAYTPPASAYGAPEPPFITPKPIYQVSHQKKGFAAQSSYAEPSYNSPVITPHKANHIQPVATVTSIFTRTVGPIDATKVQHLHSHTHVYHGAQVVPQGNDGDLTHLIDARNRANLVYSNATSAENETEVDNRDVNSSYDFADYEDPANATEAPEYYSYEDETVASGNITDVPVVRRKRETNETTEENFSDVQGLTGYTPGPQGCRAGTVCCRRPVYNPARALPVCGISNDENIHGRIKTKDSEPGRAGFGEYPWQAAILRRAEGEVVYVCGATLINQQFLVTAAHCVKDIDASLLKIRLGEWDVRDKSEFYPYVEFDVSGIYSHPEFYEGNLENDIAILRTDRFVDYSKYPHISPVCLPASRQDFSGQVCRITGWGKDGWGSEGDFQSILKETQVPILNSNLCQQILRTTKLGTSYSLPAGMVCAGGEENKDACKGDGGGPLVCRSSGGEFQLAGVVSWGLGCGQRGIPGVYVDVPYYIDWINSIIGV